MGVYNSTVIFSAVKYFGILGIVLGVFFLSLTIGVPTCIGVIVCYRKRKRTYYRLQNDHVVATTPATGGSVVTLNQTASTANPVFHAQPQYPQQPQQPVGQFTSQNASFTATAIPSLTTQQPSQVI